MRLLGGILNIFIFYYFLTLCGSADGAVPAEVEGVDSQSVPAALHEEVQTNRVPFVKEGSGEVDYLALGYNQAEGAGLKN